MDRTHRAFDRRKAGLITDVLYDLGPRFLIESGPVIFQLGKFYTIKARPCSLTLLPDLVASLLSQFGNKKIVKAR